MFGGAEGLFTSLDSAATDSATTERGTVSMRTRAGAEPAFYLGKEWCLNAFPTLEEVVLRLREELPQADEDGADWQRSENRINVFLLACALSDTVDDYLLGVHFDFSKAMSIVPEIKPAVRLIQLLLGIWRKPRGLRLRRLRHWRELWGGAVEEFLELALTSGRVDTGAVHASGVRLASLLDVEFPPDLRVQRPRVPGSFRKKDLTHYDILELGRKFVDKFPNRARPLAVVGLRTAGSYFAPMLASYLRSQGYTDARVVTLRPKRGIAPWENERLVDRRRRSGLALLVDEPIDTGESMATAMDLLRGAGFAAADVVVMIPVHPARRDLTEIRQSLSLSETHVLRLDPEEWHKWKLMQAETAAIRLLDYFRERGHRAARIVSTPAAEQFNASLLKQWEESFESRLKRVYAVHLGDPAYPTEIRYVLAESVGWGWLGYQAFIAASKLERFVPPLLGLRDGILYTEWFPQYGDSPAQNTSLGCGSELECAAESALLAAKRGPEGAERGAMIRRGASYIAARFHSLRLAGDPSSDLGRQGYSTGYQVLAKALSRVFYWKWAAALKRVRLRNELSRRVCPYPTLIDGRMNEEEWIRGDGSLLKTGFAHHALGKSALNVTDPAYDIADLILSFGLSHDEERALILRYVEESGDRGVEERLFLHKLMAGTVRMSSALAAMADPRLQSEEFNRSYLQAWNFLTVQTASYCGAFCGKPAPVEWSSPLVVLDIDGVVDRRSFGFPCSTAAGIRALSLLHSHHAAIAFDSARSLSQVREYCAAYGCIGGVAEYGGAVWDAIGGRTRVLVSPESLSQLERLRSALGRIPGVLLDDGYQYSVRAYTCTGTPQPLPAAVIGGLVRELRLDRLKIRQTTIDTTILAGETDKGRGLTALLDLAGRPEADVVAVGDSEADLAMFSVAGRSYAPAHISCAAAARRLGCQVVGAPYQRGLLEASRLAVHPRGERCARCRPADLPVVLERDLFAKLLRVADRSRLGSLFWALFDPKITQAFVSFS
jgi:adenine/guanine phosphoribosyltransferase-like PRPP-binding protein